MYLCPKCKCTDNLRVSCQTWGRLTQDEDEDSFETEQEGDLEFDDTSAMICDSCDHTGVVWQFVDNSETETHEEDDE